MESQLKQIASKLKLDNKITFKAVVASIDNINEYAPCTIIGKNEEIGHFTLLKNHVAGAWALQECLLVLPDTCLYFAASENQQLHGVLEDNLFTLTITSLNLLFI